MDVTTQSDIKRAAPIAMGRKDYLSVLFRLIGMDLYKVRRRLLSKVALLVGTLVVALTFLAIGLVALHFANEPVTDFVPAQCSVFPHNIGCINHPATVVDMQHEKQRVLAGAVQRLDVPGVWNIEEQFVVQALVVLVIILAGSLVGGEYSLGAIRLMFTRGPTRLQFLLAKMVVMTIYIIPTLLFLMLVGTGVGAGMSQLAGLDAGSVWSFFTADHLGHLALYLLLAMLYWFAYMVMALFFGTVGRSTVVGIVGPLIWLATETLLGNVITGLAGSDTGGLAALVRAIPGYFLGSNLVSLLHSQGYVLGFTAPGTYPDGQSLVVVACYLVVFVGVACWLTVRRNVVH